MMHLQDVRRPIGLRSTNADGSGYLIKQVPVICAVDLIDGMTDHGPRATRDVNAATCRDCKRIIQEGRDA